MNLALDSARLTRILMLLSVACCRPEKGSPPDGALSELHHLELDGDARPDEVALLARTEHDGRVVFDRIVVRLTTGTTAILKGRWGWVPGWFQSPGNRVRSARIYIATFPAAGNLLFVFGTPFEGRDAGIRIYQIDGQGVRAYYSAASFGGFQSLDPRSLPVASMAGVPCTAAELPDHCRNRSVVVFRLDARVAVDSAATALRNMRR